MGAHIDDLPNELLMYLFDYLSTKELFHIEVVSKKWQECIREMLSKRIIALRTIIGIAQFEIDQYGAVLIPDIINDDNLAILKNILSRCTNITRLIFDDTIVYGDYIEFAKLLHDVQRFDAYFEDEPFNEEFTELQWEQFVMMIAPQLKVCEIKMDFNYNRYNITRPFIKYINSENIEQLRIDGMEKRHDKEIFQHLKSCKNLKNLKWNYECSHHEIDCNDQNMVQVLQRLNYLGTDFGILFQLKITLDNLIELNISNFVNDIFDNFNNVMEIKDFPANQIMLPNLKKLTVSLRQEDCFNALSKMNFPNLKYLNFTNNMSPDFFLFLTEQFFKQFKNIKVFDCNGFIPNKNIIFLENLTELKINSRFCNSFEPIITELLEQFFNGLAELNNLKKIELEFFYYNNLNVNILNKIINLYTVKPHIEISFVIDTNNQNEQIINQYEIIFQQYNWMVKVQKDNYRIRVKVNEKLIN